MMLTRYTDVSRAQEDMAMYMKFMIAMGICSVSTLTAIGKSQIGRNACDP